MADTLINIVEAVPIAESLVFHHDADGNGVLHMHNKDLSLVLGRASDQVMLGASATAEVGFYGTAPIAKPVLATNDAAGIITALVNLGLVVAAE
jgi:hypothetical protein